MTRCGLGRLFIRYGAAALGSIALIACSSAPQQLPANRAAAIADHTRFLASDDLEGRETGARGYDRAAAYVAQAFAEFGLAPAGDGASYYQSVPLRRRTLLDGGVSGELQTRSGVYDLVNGGNIAVDASAREVDETLEAPLLFVGWGIDAASLSHEDYAGLNANGRIVVMLEGAPSSFPGALRAHFSWIDQKDAMAAAHGALAIITIKSPAREAVSPWDRARRLRPLPAMNWIEAGGAPRRGSTRAHITLGPELATRLFADFGYDLAAVYAALESGEHPRVELSGSMRLSRRSDHEDIFSSNVLGVIHGADPELRNEFVLVTAHLDHVGVGASVNGDAIYNGAADNAGGVAAMLEIARALASGTRARRSVIFMATTGEEKGLLGSSFFAANPTVPIESIVAVVNIDGLMAFHDFSDIVALGADHSTLGEVSARAASSVGAVHAPDPIPERGNLALSDQYPFLRLGVPVLFPNPGRGVSRDGVDGAAAWDAFMRDRYHQPSDDLNQAWRWDVAARWTDYLEFVVVDVANSESRPRWYEGDSLAALFAPHRERAPRP